MSHVKAGGSAKNIHNNAPALVPTLAATLPFTPLRMA